MNGQNRADVKVGATVKIVLKSDQRTGKLTEGIVARLLTKSSFHLHGIKVFCLRMDRSARYRRLSNGRCKACHEGRQFAIWHITMLDMGKIYFTSDNHFGHEGVIRFDNRPFASVEEMDAEMIRRWNAKVTSSMFWGT